MEENYIDSLSDAEDYEANQEHYNSIQEELTPDEYEARLRTEGNDQYEESVDNDLAFQ